MRLLKERYELSKALQGFIYNNQELSTGGGKKLLLFSI